MMIAGDTLINYNIRNFKRASEYKPLRHRGTDQRKLLDQFNKNFNLKESSDIISKLYDIAKRDPSKIELYREAIYEAIDTDPVAYIKSINKIIPSSVGLDTLYEFVYTNGISILSYQPIVESIESCIDKYNSLQKDASLYNEALEFMESFKNTYRHNFYMFENFRDSLQPNYIEAYYKNFPVLREGKEVNFAKMIERFGESVIPDMLVYASMFGNPMNVIMPFKERYDLIDNTTKLWLEECEKDIYVEGLFSNVFSSKSKNKDFKPSFSELPSELRILLKQFLVNLYKTFRLAYKNTPAVVQSIDQIISKMNSTGHDIIPEPFTPKIKCSMNEDGRKNVYMDNILPPNRIKALNIPINQLTKNQYDNLIRNVYKEAFYPLYQKLQAWGIYILFVPYDEISPHTDPDHLVIMTTKSDQSSKLYDYLDKSSKQYQKSYVVESTHLENYNGGRKHLEESVWDIIARKDSLIQESVILGEEKEISFTESELESIQDLISFKENLITLVESEEERMQLQREVYTLYEAAGDLLDEDVADSVIPMLPGANQNVGTRSINEDWLNNTHNKKTGSMPDYLKNAHDLNWGEDDDAPPKKRPSASDDDKPDDDDDLPSDDKKEKDPLDKIEPFDYDSNKSDSSDDKKDDSAKSSSGHIQNYYYYTYNNSNNTHSTTNTNSYNQSRDDHSRNKRTRSHDYAAGLKEEKQIWELDVPEFDSYQEGFLDSAQKVLSTVSRHVSTVLPKNRMQAVQEYDSAIFQRKMIIPFRQYFGKKSARTKLNESVDSFTEARAVPREYNPGHVLGMSKYDYRNIAMKLARQFGVNVIFMNSSSPINKATVATTGGAFVGCVDERKLLAMARGNKKMMQRLQNEVQQSAEENNEDIIDTLIKQTLGGSRDKGVKKYIFIDIDNMRKHFGSFRNPTALETILRHEIGHIFTLDKISDADFEKYTCARPFIMIFNGIIQQLTNLPENKILAFSNLHIYHQLLVEKAANDYARINPAALTRILLGTDAPPPIPGINLNALRDLSVPRNVASIMLTCIASGMYSNENDEALVDNFLLKDSLKKILSPQLYEKLKNIIKENDPKKYAIVFEGSSKAKKNIIPEDKVPKQIIRKTIGEAKQKNKNESVMYEDVLDDQMPKSDNPIQDTMLDLDRKLSSVQQSIKSKAQGVQRTASAIAKPFKRTSQWIGSMIARWKDANENEIKAKMADPHERSGLLSAFKSAVKYGSLMKAGLLLNPIFMFLSISRKWSNRKNTFRIRNEMIGELKAELEIIEEKIRDADHAGDRAAKYKLMRFRNELKKKLIRVGGTPEMKNMI